MSAKIPFEADQIAKMMEMDSRVPLDVSYKSLIIVTASSSKVDGMTARVFSNRNSFVTGVYRMIFKISIKVGNIAIMIKRAA
jgi:hypothetical protein